MREDIWQDCLEHWQASDGRTPFWSELAQKYGYEKSERLRYEFKNERKRRGVFKHNPTVTKENTVYEEKNDYINIVCSSPRIKTKEDVIREFDIDMDVWKIEKFIVRTDEAWRKDRKVEWEVENDHVSHGKVNDSGKILLVPLTRVEVRFTRKTLDDISLDEISKMFQKKEFSIPFLLKKKYSPSNETLEIDIADLHFGSDANHSPEKRFESAVDDIIQRIGNRTFEKILLVILGDIFHYDNVNRTTSAGTVVTTNEMTPYQVFDLGMTAMIGAVSKFAQVSPLEIVFIPGNHDRMTSYTLMKAIGAYFKDVKGVLMDAGHEPRKYREIGVNLIGWMHGDMPKSRATNWLQVQARDAWGRTKYSEIHSGNYHSQSGKEDGGVILRYVPGLTEIDDWHNNVGYVGAVRAMVSFVWDKEKGLREQWFTVC